QLGRLQQVRTRQTDEHIRSLHGIGQGALVCFGSKDGLVLVQVISTGVDDTLAVNHGNVLDRRPETDQQLHAGNGSRTGAQTYDPGIFQLLVRQLQGVDHRGRGDNGSAVLIVVEHRNVALLDQRTLDLEALGRLDILEVDAAEGAGNALDGINEGLRALRLDFDIEHVDTGEALE